MLRQPPRPGRAGATSLWATGLDSGEFGGVVCTEYRKDVPLDVALARGIVAYEIDGVPLSAERGYPARLVVPGAVIGRDVEIGGWAWSRAPVVTVDVAVDGEWSPAEVEQHRGPHVTWQRFRTLRRLQPGEHTVAVRAADWDGRAQPIAGARNASHRVTITAQ